MSTVPALSGVWQTRQGNAPSVHVEAPPEMDPVELHVRMRLLLERHVTLLRAEMDLRMRAEIERDVLRETLATVLARMPAETAPVLSLVPTPRQKRRGAA
jgi:hypothetical protein